MKKLIHERLREHDGECTDFECSDRLLKLRRSAANALADEIERYYIPRPRFEDGEPVQFGDEATYGFPSLNNQNFKVARMNFYKDGSVTLCEYGGNGHNYQPGELIKRPSPKVLDADGVEIKVGDTLWHIQSGKKFVAKSIWDDYAMSDDGFYLEPKAMTHKEPDSLEKLLDDLEWYAKKREMTPYPTIKNWSDRLSALIERMD